MAIQAKANNDGIAAPASWDTLSAEMGDGGNIDYDMFATRWEAEDHLPDDKKVLHNLIKNFDGQGVTIKTHQDQDQPEVQSSGGNDVLSATAKHAARQP